MPGGNWLTSGNSFARPAILIFCFVVVAREEKVLEELLPPLLPFYGGIIVGAGNITGMNAELAQFRLSLCLSIERLVGLGGA